MKGYVEAKKRGAKTYYYVTETVREGSRWKKKRKYLGVHTPAGFEKPRRKHPKPSLSEKEIALLETIKKNYLKKHHIGKRLWKGERGLLLSFIYNTNAIEGSTLTLEETKEALAGKRVKGKEREALEARNMKKCIDFVFSWKGKVTEEFVLKLHETEMKGAMPDAGEYRKADVRVGRYYAPRAADVPGLMSRFFSWYAEAGGALHPFELAALTHLKFVRIHPFRDGNGRISRLLMNFVLMKNKYPLLNIFEAEKMLYYLVLQKVDATKRSKPFVRYLYGAFIDQYKEYV
jgi:Fic family protein